MKKNKPLKYSQVYENHERIIGHNVEIGRKPIGWNIYEGREGEEMFVKFVENTTNTYLPINDIND
jgi:hypothetical protein